MPPLTDLYWSVDELGMGSGGASPAGIGQGIARLSIEQTPAGAGVVATTSVENISTPGTINPGSPAPGSAYPGTTWKLWNGVTTGGGTGLFLTPGPGSILENLLPNSINWTIGPSDLAPPPNRDANVLVAAILSGGAYYLALPAWRTIYLSGFKGHAATPAFTGTWFNIFDYFLSGN